MARGSLWDFPLEFCQKATRSGSMTIISGLQHGLSFLTIHDLLLWRELYPTQRPRLDADGTFFKSRQECFIVRESL